MILRGRAPYRVSSCGGGTDLPILHETAKIAGAVLSTSIKSYTYATLATREDGRCKVVSHDLSTEFFYDEVDRSNEDLRLLVAILDQLSITTGFELTIESDVSVGSRLGASGALAALLCKMVIVHEGGHDDPKVVAEKAFAANRVVQGNRVGRQDEYAAAYGGTNYIRFNPRGEVTPLKLRYDVRGELEYNTLLYRLPYRRLASDPVNEQVRYIEKKDQQVLEDLSTMAVLAKEAAGALCDGDFPEFGRLVQISGRLKQQTNPAASSKQMQEIVDGCLERGAFGSKTLGAGSGGCLIAICTPQTRHSVAAYLGDAGCTRIPFLLEDEGAMCWKILPDSELDCPTS